MRLKWMSILLIVITVAACRKSEEISYDPDDRLSFSTDTVLFDTVFTTVGSTNRKIKVYNKNNKALIISSIKLGNGSDSPFNLIINGQTLNSKENFQLDGRDSISIYAKVTINPTIATQPFIVEDSIVFMTNGSRQSIPLIAYGQNANFINGETITGNKSWSNVLPYVVYKSVDVAENATLNIAAGTRVLFHGAAVMNIRGTLLVNGTKAEPITLASDRLEQVFDDEPGQWNGLHFYSSSKNSVIQYALLKNAIVGITTDSLSVNDQPKLLLSNTILKNMEVAAFVGYGTELAAFNNLFYNCGQYLVYAVGGGRYDLKQNTLAAYNFNFPRKTAAVYFSDFRNSSQKGRLELELVNNIIWGTLEDELLVDIKTGLGFASEIRNNLIKSTKPEFDGNDNILNTDPLFMHPESQNYGLKDQSPASNKGLNLTGNPYYPSILYQDLRNEIRLFPSELGCYENK